jgi:hypothetical protein
LTGRISTITIFSEQEKWKFILIRSKLAFQKNCIFAPRTQFINQSASPDDKTDESWLISLMKIVLPVVPASMSVRLKQYLKVTSTKSILKFAPIAALVLMFAR